AGKLFHVQLLEIDASVFQRRERPALESGIAFGHPQHSKGKEEFTLPLSFVFLPEIKRARGKPGIGLIGPVSAADYPRLATRRCPRISRTPGIDERDPRSTAKKIKSSPSAERARADYRYMKFIVHES